MKIAVTGATGFIGTALVKKLIELTSHQIVAISRRSGDSLNKNIEFVACDLYLLNEIDHALKGCDVAIYLVHSMSKPASRLVQGDFRDFDFILADNFARAAARNNIKQIIYVSGLLPHDKSDLSPHLASRHEVEKVLQSWGVPVTTLRCGLVLGPNGSSFCILQRLVEKLPLFVMPTWVLNHTQVVYLDDLIKVILNLIEISTSTSKSYDVVNPEILTYESLIRRTAAVMEKSRPFFILPLIPIWFSKFWVSFITKVQKELVYPLIDSLKSSMLARPDKELPAELKIVFTPIDEALKLSINTQNVEPLPVQWKDYEQRTNEVQSVQRLPLPVGWSASDMAETYRSWITRYFASIIDARIEREEIVFNLISARAPLLKLKLKNQPEYEKRRAFDITGGWLTYGKQSGQLEFREGLHARFVLASIYRYRPRLPWTIYRLSQAILHSYVMSRFAVYLKRKSDSIH